jgi:hypothetical protein
MKCIRILIFSLFVAFSISMVAQTNTSGVSGSVMDPSGAVITGADIGLAQAATGLEKTTVSGSKGEYSFDQLLPGDYDLIVSSPGFAPERQHLQLLVATPLKIDFKLKPGTTEIVVVETTSAAINTTDGTLGKAFDSTQVSNLPYLGDNTLSLLALQPGVLAFDSTNPTVIPDPRAGTVNGARGDQTNLTLDGVDNNEVNTEAAFTGSLRATRDSVEEFRVTTSNANADSGRSSGAQVALVTRSGTNQLHGSAYYYYRDPAMASNSWFNKQTQLNTGSANTSLKVLQDTYGASLGAPILKNKLFFFGAYEGFKQASDALPGLTVPLPSYQAGNVTYQTAKGAATPTITLNPAQIAAMDTKCFAASQVSTIGGGCPNGPGVNQNIIAYMKGYPTANASGGDGGYNTGLYNFISPAPLSLITNIARLDYNITSKQVVFIRANLQGDNILAQLNAPVAAGGVPNSQTYANSRGLAAGHIWTINNQLINNFRFGWVRYGQHVQGAVTGPYITMSEFTIKTPTTTSTTSLEDTSNFADDFTIIKGRHTITVGVNDRLIYNLSSNTANIFNHAQINKTHLQISAVAGTGQSLDPTALYGAVNPAFDTSYDQAIIGITGVETWGYGVYNFKIANGSLVPIGAGIAPVRDYHSLEQEYYGQDQFKVSSKLTLTAGLRWSYLGVPSEIHGQQVAPAIPFQTFLANRLNGMATGVPYNTNVPTVTSGKVNGKPSFWTPQKLNFAPTLAFAYSPDEKTSIRGGFRLAFDHFGNGVINQFNANGSYGLAGNVFNGPNASIDANPRYVNQATQPSGIVPPLPTGGSFPTQYPDLFGSEYYSIDNTIKTPYAEVFNLTVQRQLRKGLSLTASYIGRLGRHELENTDAAMPNNLYDPGSGMTYFQATTILDQAADAGVKPFNVANMAYWQDEFPNATATYIDPTTRIAYNLKGTQAIAASTLANRGDESATIANYDVNPAAAPAGQTYRYFHPQYASLFAQQSTGSSNYNGLQLSIRHTINHSFTYDFNYTYAKSMDLGSSPERTNGNVITNTQNPRQMYAVSDFDVRHAVTADWVTAIPFGHGQHWGASSSRLVDEVLGGWQITGIAKYTGPLPFSAIDNHGWPITWEAMSLMVKTGAPLQNSGHHARLAPTGSTPGFVENAFGSRSALPNCTTNCTAPAFREPYLGETGQRNDLRSDGYFSVDSGLTKSFHTFEKQSLRLTVEAFNVFNTTRFGSPANSAFLATFGQYSSTSLESARVMQIAGRYTF